MDMIRYHCDITVTVPAIYYSRLFHFLNTPYLSHIYLFFRHISRVGHYGEKATIISRHSKKEWFQNLISCDTEQNVPN